MGAHGPVDLAQVVDAVHMVGMIVGVEHRRQPIDPGIQQLFTAIGRGVDQNRPFRSMDQDGRAAAAVAWIIGIAGPQPREMLGTPPAAPHPRMVAFMAGPWKTATEN